MTNSMIPYSFIPGTKAKAGEVNANFVALADTIEANKTAASGDIEDVKEILKTKADKTELINEHTVTESETDLNDYKTKGTYIFSSVYKPNNIPKGDAGTLIVTGDDDSLIKQIWFCTEENPEIFTRNYTNSEWSEWKSNCGDLENESLGYLHLQNGIIIQWGSNVGSVVTYPIAYTKYTVPLFAKNGYGASFERSDTGIEHFSLTGFNVGSCGVFNNMHWMAIGY
jgi:hypothetical protein